MEKLEPYVPTKETMDVSVQTDNTYTINLRRDTDFASTYRLMQEFVTKNREKIKDKITEIQIQINLLTEKMNSYKRLLTEKSVRQTNKLLR